MSNPKSKSSINWIFLRPGYKDDNRVIDYNNPDFQNVSGMGDRVDRDPYFFKIASDEKSSSVVSAPRVKKFRSKNGKK